MKSIVTNLLLLLTYCSANAQLQFSWAKAVEGFNYPNQSQVQADRVLCYKKTNVYLCGQFMRWADFNPGLGIDSQQNPLPYLNSFISKYDSVGNYMWTKVAPGPAAYALDTAGNIYMAGIFDGTRDFDPGPGLVQLTATYNDLYLMKLDKNYNLIWAKNAGTCNSEFVVKDLRVNTSGGLFVAGYFSGVADFNPGASFFNTDKFQGSLRDGFVVKYSNTGTLQWVSDVYGPGGDAVYQMALDASGNPVACGYTGNSLGTTPTIFKGTASSYSMAIDANGVDGFIARYNANGGIAWAKAQRGGSSFFPYSITVDGTGAIYTGGVFNGTFLLDSANNTSTISANAGASDSYLMKFSAGGNFLWSKVLGSSSDDGVMAVCTDSSNDVYASGYYSAAMDLNPGGTTVNCANNGNRDVFIARYSSAGTYKWSTHFGSPNMDEPAFMQFASDGSLYSAGYISSTTDFNPGGANGLVNIQPVPNINPPYLPRAYMARFAPKATAIAPLHNSLEQEAFTVFPNPNNGEFKLQATLPYAAGSGTIEVQIVDALGKVVHKQNSQSNQAIDISGLPTGIYVLQLTDSKGNRQSLRISKQ